MELKSLPLDPMEGFVLSRIQGDTTITDVADLTGLAADAVHNVVTKLVDLGAVAWVSTPDSAAPHSTATTANGPAAGGGIPNASRSENGLYDPAELEEDVELGMERRRTVLGTYYRLSELNHYQLLDVPLDAAKSDIRSAYFALSKMFHPDTLYGKNLGSYKRKMEAVFKQLTEAYEVLGKKRRREEYDSYMALRAHTEAAQSGLAEVEEEAQTLAAETNRPPAPESAPPASPSLPRTRPSVEERRRRAQQLFSKRLAGATGRRNSSGAIPAQPGSTPPDDEARGRRNSDRAAVLRGLASSLKRASDVTGQSDHVEHYLQEAQTAEKANDLLSATKALRFASTLAPEREDIKEDYRRVKAAFAASLAETYEKQAVYEEQHRKWAEAAQSWLRVCEGRPEKIAPLMRAASALLKTGDSSRHKQAKELAETAVRMRPEDVRPRVTLAEVFIAAGMKLNAKRELDMAAKLDSKDEMVKNLLREVRRL